jgi:hypothetical protein
MRLTGVYLTGVYLTGVHFTGVHLISQAYLWRYRRISYKRIRRN